MRSALFLALALSALVAQPASAEGPPCAVFDNGQVVEWSNGCASATYVAPAVGDDYLRLEIQRHTRASKGTVWHTHRAPAQAGRWVKSLGSTTNGPGVWQVFYALPVGAICNPTDNAYVKVTDTSGGVTVVPVVGVVPSSPALACVP